MTSAHTEAVRKNRTTWKGVANDSQHDYSGCSIAKYDTHTHGVETHREHRKMGVALVRADGRRDVLQMERGE